MELFRRFFKKEASTPVPYIESTTLPEPEQDKPEIRNLDKAQVKDLLDRSLPPMYKDPSQESSIKLQEIRGVHSKQEVDDRLTQLNYFLEVATHGLFLEVMKNYDKFGEF